MLYLIGADKEFYKSIFFPEIKVSFLWRRRAAVISQLTDVPNFIGKCCSAQSATERVIQYYFFSMHTYRIK